jgi:Xaa-Pro dipeptidase
MWGVDGDKTVGISDTIRVTDDGCASFFDLEEDFTVKPDRSAPIVAQEATPAPVDEHNEELRGLA